MNYVSKLASALLVASAICSPSYAQTLGVPIVEYSEEDLDTCSLGKVAGLSSSGDGFLAVRSGPGTDFAKLGEIHNGDEVWIFDQRGEWIGIVYDAEWLSCGPIPEHRLVNHEGKKGWVHQKWIELIAS